MKSRQWTKDRYWVWNGTRDWIFSSGETTLINAGYTKIERHRLIKLDKIPFLKSQVWLGGEGTLKSLTHPTLFQRIDFIFLGRYNNFGNAGPLRSSWFFITVFLTPLLIELSTCNYHFFSPEIRVITVITKPHEVQKILQCLKRNHDSIR
jgi:hypothetical protein